MTTFGKILVIMAIVLAVSVVGFAEPELTDLQKLRIERINLLNRNIELEKENAGLRIQLQALKVAIDRAQLQDDIEKANPGFVWDPATGAFTAKELPNGDIR